MQSKKILFLGFGDIARRTALLLQDHKVVGVARSQRTVPAGVEFWQGAADSLALRQRLASESFDAVILTLTPTEHSAQAYALSYVETVSALLPVWQVQPPGLIVFVSSTSVYHQQDGEWVDEASPTTPTHFTGQILLQAESLLLNSGLPACVVRFAGIYGPGRDFLLRQVRSGKGGSADFTNRIHADDCAGVLAHLVSLNFTGRSLSPIYLGCDSTPVAGQEVRTWLAEQVGIDPVTLQPSVSERGGNKRCSNRLLLASGYNFIYPSYREGYGALLDSGALTPGMDS